MRDDVRHAYATLGLPSGASPEQIKRRYRALVKVWHPDRFASDLAGQAAATERMMQFNRAYRVLLEAGSSSPGLSAAESPAVPPQGASRSRDSTRLSRDEIDDIARAIGTESPVDWLLGRLEWALWPMDSALRRIPSPRSIGIGLLLLLAVIAVDLSLGRSLAYPFTLAMVVGAILWSRWKGPR